MRYKIYLCILFLLAASGWLLGHGIQVEVKQLSPVVVITSGYSQASPLKDAAVTIFAPDENKFQTGRTDLMGGFTFKPDRDGSWKFIVDDGTGHKKEVLIDINKSFFSEEQSRNSYSTPMQKPAVFCALPLYLKILLGLSLIFGIFGIFTLIRVGKAKS